MVVVTTGGTVPIVVGGEVVVGVSVEVVVSGSVEVVLVESGVPVVDVTAVDVSDRCTCDFGVTTVGATGAIGVNGAPEGAGIVDVGGTVVSLTIVATGDWTP